MDNHQANDHNYLHHIYVHVAVNQQYVLYILKYQFLANLYSLQHYIDHQELPRIEKKNIEYKVFKVFENITSGPSPPPAASSVSINRIIFVAFVKFSELDLVI